MNVSKCRSPKKKRKCGCTCRKCLRRNRLIDRLHHGGGIRRNNVRRRRKKATNLRTGLVVTNGSAQTFVQLENERLKMRFFCYSCRIQRFTIVVAKKPGVTLLFCSKSCQNKYNSSPKTSQAQRAESSQPPSATQSQRAKSIKSWIHINHPMTPTTTTTLRLCTGMGVKNRKDRRRIPSSRNDVLANDLKETIMQNLMETDKFGDFQVSIGQPTVSSENKNENKIVPHPTEESIRQLHKQLHERQRLVRTEQMELYYQPCSFCKSDRHPTAKCDNCGHTRYCSATCQSLDWISHSFICVIKNSSLWKC